LSSESTKAEFHEVGDAEADAIVEACKHAIPHNEWLGRLVRNMYGRIKALEKEVADLKAKKSKPKRSVAS
jgi:hypothetical protein